MKQNLVILILAVLLVIIFGSGIYCFAANQKLQTVLKEAERKIEGLNSEIQTLRNEKSLLETKISKGLAYTEYLDIFLWPVFVESGITPPFKFSDEVEWILELRKRSEQLNDKQLRYHLEMFEKDGDIAFDRMFNYILDAVEKSLR